MKNISIFNLIPVIFSLLLVLTTWGENFASEQNPFYRKSFGLVVGINDYSVAGPKWKSLDYAKGDALAVAKLLKGLGFDVIELYDRDATRANILDGLETNIASRIGEDDRVIFFFSGHGDTRVIGNKDYGYLIPYDGARGYSSYIAVQELAKSSQILSLCKHQLFIIDACYGGLLGNTKDKILLEQERYPTYLLETTSRMAKHILTAGGKDQKVTDFGPKGHSIFTGAFLAAIGEGKADSYRDGFITFIELANYLLPAASTPRQTPGFDEFNGHEQGVFVFKSPKRKEVEVVLNRQEAETTNKLRSASDPVIDFFDIAPLSVIAGSPIKMQWKARNGNCTIKGVNHEIGNSGTLTVRPTKTQTFKLICSANQKEAVSSITVDVTEPVRILKFGSSKQYVTKGETVDLLWQTESAQACSINPNLGSVGASGSLSVVVHDTTTLELVCSGENGPVSRQLALFVEQPSLVIDSFVTSEKEPARGEAVQLSWRANNAEYCSLSEGIGRVNSAGIKSVTVQERVTYTLSCYQGSSIIKRKITLTPQDRVRILSFKASDYNINEGDSIELNWRTENGRSCKIDNGIGKVDLNDMTYQNPVEDTRYTLTCNGTGGPVSEEVEITVHTVQKETFQKLPPGTVTLPCGCHGFVQFGAQRANPNCSSGWDVAVGCQDFCLAGGFSWGAVCL